MTFSVCRQMKNKVAKMCTRRSLIKIKKALYFTSFLLLYAVSGKGQVIWSSPAGTAWLTGSNWTGGAVPSSTDIAQFGANPTSATIGVGINMDTALGTASAGAIFISAARTNNLLIGNSSAGTAGVLTLTGTTVNGIPNVFLGNYATNFSKLTIQNTQGSGSSSMSLNIGSTSGNIITDAGNATSTGNIINITVPISGTGALTFLGNGTWDAGTATGNNGGLLKLGATNNISGGIVVGTNTGASSGILELDVPGAISNAVGNDITINPNSQLYLAAAGGSTFATSNTTLNLKGNGNGYATTGKGALINLSGSNYTWSGNVNLSTDAGITVAGTSSNTLTLTGNVSGTGQLIKQGAGNLELSGTGNSWTGGTMITSGKIIVDGGSAISNGPLVMAQNLNNTSLVLNNTVQEISSLSSSFTGTNNSNTLTLNGTRLIINQNTNTIFGGATSTLTSNITGTGSVLKTGTGRLTLTSSMYSFSGGLNIVSGEIRLNPSFGTNNTYTFADTLSGGTLSTDSISRTFTFNYSTLALTGNSIISLGTDTLHSIKFAASSGIGWVTGKTLTIRNWRGTWNGTAGTKGRIYFGTNSSGLSATQLGQIRFIDTAGNIFQATLLGTGELVPSAPAIITTGATYGPFCYTIDNFMSVFFTYTGPFTGNFLVQLSGPTGTFTNDFVTNIVGSGTTSPITATIPMGTAPGTGYRLRVINEFPVNTFGTSNLNNITETGIPTVLPITGPSLIPVGSNVQLADASGTGVWSSVTPAIATVTASSGVVYGVSAGVATISFAYTNFCGLTGYTSRTVTVVPIPSIVSVSPNTAIPGTTITISGNNFNSILSDNIVFFGTTRALPLSLSPGSLAVTVPANAIYSPITVTDTTTGLSAMEQLAFTPTYDNSGLIADSINFKNRFNLTSGSTPVGLCTGDLDGDGKPDLVIANNGPNNIYVYRNISNTGTLNASSFNAPITYTTGSGPYYIKIADVDGDGKPEIIVANAVGGTISVFKNNSTPGSVSFAGKVDFSAGNGSLDLAIADFDGDGKPDIVVVAQSGNQVNILRNKSVQGVINGTSFAGSISFNTGITPFRIFAGDLNGDGKPDIAVTNYTSNSISLLKNVASTGIITGTSFANAISLPAGPNPTTIAGADIDNDGKTDLVVTNLNDSSISVFRNTNSTPGTFSFAGRVAFRTDSMPEDLSISDINGDGKPDLVVGNYGANTLSIFRNTAVSGNIDASSLSARSALITGVHPSGLVACDMDSDGKPDIAVANGGSSSLSIFKNYPLPPNSPITGPDSICIGTTTTFSSATPGGTWVSKNPSVATITTNGIVTSLAQGVDTLIYYTVAHGDTNVSSFRLTVEVYTIVGTITSSGTTLCAGASVSLANSIHGGIWTSSDNAVASVDTSGFVTGHTSGGVNITYSITTSCGSSTDTIHLNVLPGTGYVIGLISGPHAVCSGTIVTLTDSSSGGHWMSGIPAVASIDPISGAVSGISSGNTLITYALAGSCGIYQSTFNITVDTLLNASIITGQDSVCQGAMDTLSDAAGTGGFWLTSNPNASVSPSGILTGLFAGVDTITYAITNSCGAVTGTKIITIKAPPFAGSITGLSSVCPTASITLSATVTGGAWSRTNSKASISATGVLTGTTAGVDTIRYAVANSCGVDTATSVIAVLPPPNAGALLGASTVCLGSSITLRDTISGGTWSGTYGFAGVADSIITGLTPGIDTVKYTTTNSCGTATAIKKITVIAISPVDSIQGPTSVCTGNSISLTNAVDSGTWSKTNAHATVSLTGVVTGVSAGIDTIKYTAKGTCPMTATKVVSVNQAPSAGTITGPSSVCAGDTIKLKDTVMGGVWSNTNLHSTFTDSLFAGITAGVDTIKYTITSACGFNYVKKAMTVNPQPYAASVTGSSSLYVGDIITLKDSTTGGVWGVYGKNAIVTLDGKVGGLKEGKDTIKYSVTNVCGTYIAKFPITILSSQNPGTIVDIKLYPNPNTGKFTANVVSKISENISIVIANPAYQIMDVLSTTTNKDTVIDLNLADGVYFLSAVSQQGWFTIRFVVAK